jgi:hypothetical protein
MPPMDNRLLRPRASGLFDPRSISGCICNLDASVLSSLKQNSNGTTDATATDDPVGFVSDLSGLGNNAVQSVATGSRPFLKLNNQNGRPGLLFDGSNDWLAATIAGFQSLAGVTVIQVFKTVAAAAADTNSGFFWSFGNVASAGGGFPSARALALASSSADISGETVTALVDRSGSAGRLGSSSYARAANTAQMLATQMSGSGTSLIANNLSVTLNLSSNANTTTPAGPSDTGFTVDNNVHIGALRVGGNILVGPSWTLHQQIVYNRVLTAAELTTVWNAMRGKWGIT